MMCEKCWGDAYMRARESGKSQGDVYRELVAERASNPCTLDEQNGYLNSKSCCMASHANAKAPWPCTCKCHDVRTCPHCDVQFQRDELHMCADTQESESCA